MKKLFSLFLILVMCLSFAACSSKDSGGESSSNAGGNAEVSETTEAPKAEAVKFNFNEKIMLDFAEITFEESYIKEDIRETVEDTSSSIKITRTFGPSPEDGKQFICFKGKIKNIAKTELPVYDFFIGEFDIDGYKFEVTANNCDVYTSNGETESSIPPLTEYSFIMYTDVPDELANNNKAINYKFGFYDMFDNSELSRNKAFEDDPISLCPYQYAITVK
ncbi:MAG: hypothetical protein IJO03_09755 [Clostridia bacterium]|nr:hypothetical protein [Clostridia bacterium]